MNICMNDSAMYIRDGNYVFLMVLWPSALECKDEILEELKNHFGATDVREYCLDKEVFQWVVHIAYLYDWIPEMIVQKKYEIISDRFKKNQLRLWMKTLELKGNREFFDERDRSLHSMTINNLKQKIRGKYKKKTENYIHDILVHISDNYHQTVSLHCIEVVLSFLQKYEEVIIKKSVEGNCINLEVQIDVERIVQSMRLWENKEADVKICENMLELYLGEECICKINCKI